MIMTEHAPAPPLPRPQAATAGQARGREPKKGQSLLNLFQGGFHNQFLPRSPVLPSHLPRTNLGFSQHGFQIDDVPKNPAGLEDSGGEPIHADTYHSRTRMKGEPESEGDELSREEKRQERERQRKAVLAEIVATEKAYVDNLSILMRHFYRPLTEAATE